MDAGDAVDDARGREVRAGDVLHQAVDVDLGIVDQRDGGVDHFRQVVRRDVGRHADRDAGRTVDQQVREPRRHHRRLVFLLVVVGLEVDGFLVDVGHQLVREPRHARLRCNASPRRSRRRPNRSCPARPPAGSAARTAAPCAPACRTPTGRRAGGTYRSRHRRCAPTCSTACCCARRARSSRTARGDAPASGRRGRPGARGRRSRSSRNRGSCGASRLRG